MKVQILYASLTGCTRRLAEAIAEGLSADEVTLHSLADGLPVLDGDILLIGYWGISGGPDEKTQELLKCISGKAVGVFCTLGYYADSDHAFQTAKAGIALLKDRNEIIGSYVCNGAVAGHLMEGQGKKKGQIPTEQKEIRWEITASHPTAAECTLAAERFRERIALYTRCRELSIPFQSIL